MKRVLGNKHDVTWRHMSRFRAHLKLGLPKRPVASRGAAVCRQSAKLKSHAGTRAKDETSETGTDDIGRVVRGLIAA